MSTNYVTCNRCICGELKLKIGSAFEDWSNPALNGVVLSVMVKLTMESWKKIDESDIEVQCIIAVGENWFIWPDYTS